jgi:oxygen-independent coproporphyrinogen III oxidase
VLKRFGGAINSLREDGYLAEASADRIALTREALMRVDVLLPRFFLPEHTGIRYT